MATMPATSAAWFKPSTMGSRNDGFPANLLSTLPKIIPYANVSADTERISFSKSMVALQFNRSMTQLWVDSSRLIDFFTYSAALGCQRKRLIEDRVHLMFNPKSGV